MKDLNIIYIVPFSLNIYIRNIEDIYFMLEETFFRVHDLVRIKSKRAGWPWLILD